MSIYVYVFYYLIVMNFYVGVILYIDNDSFVVNSFEKLIIC